jgi:hypothetical protein
VTLSDCGGLWGRAPSPFGALTVYLGEKAPDEKHLPAASAEGHQESSISFSIPPFPATTQRQDVSGLSALYDSGTLGDFTCLAAKVPVPCTCLGALGGLRYQQ